MLRNQRFQASCGAVVAPKEYPGSFTVSNRPKSRVRVAQVTTEAEAYVPERKFLDREPDYVWRNGKPEYTVVNKAYLMGKTRNWKAGSLESLVESVVKTLEMEISHKVCLLATRDVFVANLVTSSAVELGRGLRLVAGATQHRLSV